jgi:hypothetical protein
MCMRYIDNMVNVKSTSPSKTWTNGFLLDDGLCTRVSNDGKSPLVPTDLRGNAQETLTREKRCCESRRKLMFPHFFGRANRNLRTRSPGTCIASGSQEGLWITHLRSRRGGESSREGVEDRGRSMSIYGSDWRFTHMNSMGTCQRPFDSSYVRTLTWAWRAGTCCEPSDLAIVLSERAGSTSAGVAPAAKVTAKTARMSHQLGPHAATRTSFGSEALRAESHGKSRRCQ